MISLSFTKIEKFTRCPLEYKYYLDKEIYRRYHKDTPALLFGSIMHGIFNDFYKHLTTKERHQERMVELFKQKYNANKIKHDQIFKSREVLEKFAKMASTEFKNFLNSKLSQQTPYVATEENIKVDLGGVELIAKIDRLDTGAKGFSITDYKTGRYIDEKPNPLQLDLYSLAVFNKFPDIPIHEKQYFYLYDGRFISIKVNQGEYRTIRDQVLKIADQITKEKEFKPKKNQKCVFCDFRSICPLFS